MKTNGLATAALLSLMLTACGGGGGGSSPTPPPAPPPPAPSGLSYPAPPTYNRGVAITALNPTVTGTPTSYTINPALPAGLALNATSGVISGTPTAVQAATNHQVTATNAGGSATATVAITVRDILVDISYPRANYALLVGQPMTTATPTVTGGVVSTWSISRPLPAGLNFDTASGVISGTPTALAATLTYTVSAQNSAGTDTFDLLIGVQSGVLLELGHTSPVSRLQYDGSRIVSNSDGRCILWNAQTGAIIRSFGSGRSSCSLAGSTLIHYVQGFPFETLNFHSSDDGSLLGYVERLYEQHWTLATDGSYLVINTGTNLLVYSRTGSLLVTVPGTFNGQMFLAPGEIRVANNPSDPLPHAIRYISVPSGTVTAGPPYDGAFHRWFLDGERFFTSVGTIFRIYSRTGIQQDFINLSSVANLAGKGNWYWAPGKPLRIFAVGSGGVETANFVMGEPVTASGSVLAAFESFDSDNFSIIDMSGPVPVKADYVSPYHSPRHNPPGLVAAVSANDWIFSESEGVISGRLGAGPPRRYSIGAVRSIAGSSTRLAVATAAGEIFHFDAATRELEGTILRNSSKVALSMDGSVLGAFARVNHSEKTPDDRKLRLYSLPSQALVHEFPEIDTADNVWVDFQLSASGQIIGQALPVSGQTLRVMRADGTVLWSGVSFKPMIRLNPSGTRFAIPGNTAALPKDAVTNMYLVDGTLTGAAFGVAVGWLDDEHLLVNRYVQGSGTDQNFNGAQIVDTTGRFLSSLPIQETDEIQPLGANQFYSPRRNNIFDGTTGNIVWSTTSPSASIGAVAGNNVYFLSGTTVRVEPR